MKLTYYHDMSSASIDININLSKEEVMERKENVRAWLSALSILKNDKLFAGFGSYELLYLKRELTEFLEEIKKDMPDCVEKEKVNSFIERLDL